MWHGCVLRTYIRAIFAASLILAIHTITCEIYIYICCFNLLLMNHAYMVDLGY